MLASRPVGRDAATKKYDILSALMAFALARDKLTQRLILRLMSLITTRYNWQRDELSMGQREIAKLWSVDERTVKREMAKLKSKGWLRVKRPGARGRVTLYGFDLDLVLKETEPEWPKIGPDFVVRLTEMSGLCAQNMHQSNVVAFSAKTQTPPAEDGTIWSSAALLLFGYDPMSYTAWFQQLHEESRDGGCLTLIAPTKFHATYVETHLSDAILSAVSRIDSSLRSVRIHC
jgi:hypothetical protein